MFFADVLPTPNGTEFGNWMIGAIACVGIVYLILQVFFLIFPREKTVPQQPVTHGELETFRLQFATFATLKDVEQLKSQIALCATREEVSRLEKDIEKLGSDLQKHQADMRTSLHRMRDDLQPIAMKVNGMNIILKLIANKSGIAVDMNDIAAKGVSP